jgi:hypothetical protein
LVEGDIKVERYANQHRLSLSGAQTLPGSNSRRYNDIDVTVACGQKEVLEGRIGMGGRPSHLGWLEAPDGNWTASDIVKLFEAIAKSKGPHSVELIAVSGVNLFREDYQSGVANPEIRSTVLMTLVSGELSG